MDILSRIIEEGITNSFELSCYDSRKSFYGKAWIIETEKGRYLKSYETIVCFLSYGGTFEKLWDGYSATTMRHINSFLCFTRYPADGGKTWWDELPMCKSINGTNHSDMTPAQSLQAMYARRNNGKAV